MGVMVLTPMRTNAKSHAISFTYPNTGLDVTRSQMKNIGKFLVSVPTASKPHGWDGFSFPFGNNSPHPVTGITWHDSIAYCRWLSIATGNDYGLPSEAEWEAARGTDEQYAYLNEEG